MNSTFILATATAAGTLMTIKPSSMFTRDGKPKTLCWGFSPNSEVEGTMLPWWLASLNTGAVFALLFS